MKKQTPVVFRKYPDGEVIALFPFDRGSNVPRTCMSYMHVGQHAAADYTGVIASTRPAKSDEFAPLFRELTRSVGYDDLVIRSRRPARKL